ncbi:MAG TPA: cytochrome P450 [Myxococcota bacterium]|nr:cytochrome P450 [Myxococcota bacterium]
MAAAAQEAPASPFLAPGFMEDPYPTLARLRAEDPVHWVPLGFWLVLRHDDVKRLFNDPENATPDRRVWEHFVPRPEGTFMRWVEDNGFFSLPAEEHARLRKLFSVALTPRAVKRYEAQVRETVERFAAPLREARGVVDLMETFANPIPNAVISRITGIPPAGDDERRFRELAQSTIRGFFSFSDEASKQRGEEAFVAIADWVRRLAKERRSSLGEDLVSDLIRAQDRGDRLSDDQIVMTITGLIGAGSETTSIGGMIAAMTLLDHPDQMEELRREPALIPNAISEILRFSFGGPAGLPRYAVRDFELRGKQIRKGQMMLLSFGGAGRDPAVYDDPDRFDVRRDVKDLVTFGNGPHYCLGANLARQEMGCMVEAMLGFLPPGSRWLKEEMQFEPSGLFRRPVTLPVSIAR